MPSPLTLLLAALLRRPTATATSLARGEGDAAASRRLRPAEAVPGLVDHHDVDGSCRKLVAASGEAGWLKACVPADQGGLYPALDVRTLCITRATLAYVEGLADFAFAMQGLGTGVVSLFGTPRNRRRSAAARRSPRRQGHRRLRPDRARSPAPTSRRSPLHRRAGRHPTMCGSTGEKTWISNGGIADRMSSSARTGEAPGARGLSAFLVEADTPGLSIAERLDTIAPHPLARLAFDGCRVPLSNARIGKPGGGFKPSPWRPRHLPLRRWRRRPRHGHCRALDEATRRAKSSIMFGAPLADLQLTQAALADSVAELEAAALLVFRAAWAKDQGKPRITKRGGHRQDGRHRERPEGHRPGDPGLRRPDGVKKGEKVEELYREIRALRIYEGATEVQKVVIARAHLAEAEAAAHSKAAG
jgi:acyl-CoA dehydrogenase